MNRAGHEPAPAVEEQAAPPPPARSIARTFDALALPQFRWLWMGTIASFMAMQMQQLARGYLAYDLTGAATALGVVTLAAGVPMVLAPVGGMIVDRVAKRTLLMATEVVMAATTFVIALLVVLQLVEIWHLAVLSFLQGTSLALNMPARVSFVPMMVPRERLSNALALNSTGPSLTRLVGPATAGALVAIPLVGLAGTFMVMAAIHLLVAVLMLPIQQRGEPAPRGAGEAESTMQELTAGIRFIGIDATLRVLMFLAFLTVMLGMPFNFLLPVFAADVYRVGAAELGVLMTASGAGGLLGTLGVAYFATIRRKWLAQLCFGVVFGAVLVAFALNPLFGAALGLLVLLGICSNAFITFNHMMILLATPQRLYGRVMALYMTTFGFVPIALLPYGVVIDAIGVQLAVAIGGAVLTVLVGLILVFARADRQVEPS